MATSTGNRDTYLPRHQPQQPNRYGRTKRRRTNKHLGGNRLILFKFILVVGFICHAVFLLVVDHNIIDLDSTVRRVVYTAVEAVETVAPTENYHVGGDDDGHVNTYDADNNDNHIDSNYDNNDSDDQPLDQMKEEEGDRIPDIDDGRSTQNEEEEGEDQVHRNVPLDVLDERTWLDIYADQTKTLLIDSLTKYWNELRQYQTRHDDDNDDVTNNVENDSHHHHQWQRLRRKIQHINLTRIASSINNDRVHSFLKKVSIRTAMTISSSFKRLTEWSRPFRNKVRYQSQSIKYKTSQRTQHIVSGIEDRFQFIAERLGHDICNDLRQRCQEEQQQRQLYNSSSLSTPTANESSGSEEDPTMTMTTKPILQLAWQERLLCYRSVVIEDCLLPV
mmetsp:Transcript_32867/g.79905  ORF Transcript_32867/g.79905 Transcript_32867/m.79905 type:complete len:390 (+) Transcript_32867:105-1274(+)